MLSASPEITIVPASAEIFAQGWERFRNRSDKEWGLTDCISCGVMERYETGSALTSDEHFVQAGFRALLLEV